MCFRKKKTFLALKEIAWCSRELPKVMKFFERSVRQKKAQIRRYLSSWKALCQFSISEPFFIRSIILVLEFGSCENDWSG